MAFNRFFHHRPGFVVRPSADADPSDRGCFTNNHAFHLCHPVSDLSCPELCHQDFRIDGSGQELIAEGESDGGRKIE